ncbi:Hypothetical protein R9X50_00433500 [Acrodontium crateriforme]|uniref:N-acetyltransferase domain-containing protein n=1 Tax=Acrodontium crateriforme TaxID=150365 RepID=A0AAQ3M4J6_9PEZI|nr:Hypothetical protein R9X50_00433500 [Acrodontium crateriforme]
MAADTAPEPLTQAPKQKLNGQHLPGPTVNGQPTVATLLNPDELASSPLLDSLGTMINAAFTAGHSTKNILGGTKRLNQPSDLPVQIGSSPGTFTVLVTDAHESNPRVLGTVSAKPYSVPLDIARNGTKKSAFLRLVAPTRRAPRAPVVELWELKFLAVDPSLQRQGLAVFLLDLAEAEVRRRSEAKRSVDVEPGTDVELVMVLTTIDELVGPFYMRRGYELDYKSFQDIGYMGTEVGFTIAHYSKLLN